MENNYPNIFEEIKIKSRDYPKLNGHIGLYNSYIHNYIFYFSELGEDNNIYLEMNINTFWKTYSLKWRYKEIVSDQHIRFHYGLEEMIQKINTDVAKNFLLFNLNLFRDCDSVPY